jgi:hypothetical protein
MLTPTEIRSTTVAPLRRLRDRPAAATPLSSHPHDSEGVEERGKRDEHGYQGAVAGTNGLFPVAIRGYQSQTPLA